MIRKAHVSQKYRVSYIMPLVILVFHTIAIGKFEFHNLDTQQNKFRNKQTKKDWKPLIPLSSKVNIIVSICTIYTGIWIRQQIKIYFEFS